MAFTGLLARFRLDEAAVDMDVDVDSAVDVERRAGATVALGVSSTEAY